MLLVAVAGGCSSTTKGDVSATCPDDGGCEPRPVFATGILSAILVTSDAVYAGDLGGNVYAADKPLRASRVLSAGTNDTRNVASFVRTSRGLYWFTSPNTTQQEPHPKSSLVWFPSDGTEAVVIDTQLERPRGIAAINDIVYLAVPGHVLALDAGARQLRSVLDVEAYGLRSDVLSLYFHDGLSKISSWRLGDAKPQVLVEDAVLYAMPSASMTLAYEEDPFVVDDSGLYWLELDLGRQGLAHAPLSGGPSERPITIAKDYPKAIALDDGHVYWTQADSLFATGRTTIHRAAKNALATSDVVLGTIVGDATGLQAMPEGLYIAASPSITDFDVNSLGFKRYGGPLLILPRAMLDAR